MTKSELEREYWFAHEQSKLVHEEQERRAVAVLEEIKARFHQAQWCEYFFEGSLCNLLEEARQTGADWENFVGEYLPRLCGPLEHGKCQCYKTAEGTLALLDDYNFTELFQEYLEF